MSQWVLTPEPALALLAHCPSYEATPIKQIQTAKGTQVWVKDETARFGLGSFKGLGGIYAAAEQIRDRWEQVHGDPMPNHLLTSDAAKEIAQSLHFVCASAGNHGLAVARGAQLFGAHARIFLSQQVPEYFAQQLRQRDANVIRAGKHYEASMQAAMEDAQHTGAILLADSSWPGYTKIPLHIMQGYCVMGEELRQWFLRSQQWPTHVYLQAGVGGLAGALAQHIRQHWLVQPQIYVVEPDRAACLSASNLAGKPTEVQGDVSNMGRLDCKQPSLVAHEILQQCRVEYLGVSDQAATHAMQHCHQKGLYTTESGAAGLAGLLATEARLRPGNAPFQPLIIATEQASTNE